MKNGHKLPTKEEKPEKRHPRIKKICAIGIPALIVFIILYLGLGILCSSLVHPAISEDFAAAFDADSFYSEETGTERVAAVETNEEALLWRLALINDAEDSIIVSTFDLRADEGGYDVIAALYAAAERGVQVRMLVDGLNGLFKIRLNAAFRALCAHENVEVRFYNPVNVFKPWRLTYRMHDKYLIADDTVYLLGGRNTNSLFLGETDGRQNRDRDLLVYETDLTAAGTSLQQVEAYFSSIWELSCNKTIHCRKTAKVQAAGEELLAYGLQSFSTLPEEYLHPDYEACTVAANKITLLSNGQQDGAKEPVMWNAVLALMAHQNDVLVETPYIVLNDRMYQDLTDACADIGSLRIVINATESGANPWGCTDYINQKEKLWQTGAVFYEMIGDCSSHTKTVLVGDRLSIVGSYNMDMRSTYLDTELMLAVDCEALNAELRASAEEDMERSRMAVGDGTYLYGENFPDVELSRAMKAFYRMLQALLPPFRSMI